MYIIAATTVDLDVILLIIGICMILAVGVLLVMLLIRLNRMVSRVNTILKSRERDIQRTIANLPELTENISGASAVIKDAAKSVSNIAGKVDTVVDTVSPANIFGKIPVIFESAKKAFEYVSSRMKNDSCEDADGEDDTVEDII